MKLWTVGDLHNLKMAKKAKMKMATIEKMFPAYGRDSLVEALDALTRTDSLVGAGSRVNEVLFSQADGIPLINGRRADLVEGWVNQPMKPRPIPMF